MLPKITGFRVERNPSYTASVRTGLKLGVWWAPTTLATALAEPIIGLIMGVVVGAARAVAWTALCLMLVVLGLAGFLVSVPNNQG